MAAHCNAMINYDIDMIVKYIELNYGPEEICSLIGMCDKDEQQKVGDFWCESCYVRLRFAFALKNLGCDDYY